jgi:chitinase
MTHEYVGNWSPLSGDIANLLNSTRNPSSTPFNTARALDIYLLAGIPVNKLIMGMPLFGRSFSKTAGPGSSYTPKNSSLEEVFSVKNLPLPGAIEYWDPTTGSSFSYDHKTREMISYDNFGVATQKALYIINNGFGGAMWWESSGDRI